MSSLTGQKPAMWQPSVTHCHGSPGGWLNLTTDGEKPCSHLLSNGCFRLAWVLPWITPPVRCVSRCIKQRLWEANEERHEETGGSSLPSCAKVGNPQAVCSNSTTSFPLQLRQSHEEAKATSRTSPTRQGWSRTITPVIKKAKAPNVHTD